MSTHRVTKCDSCFMLQESWGACGHPEAPRDLVPIRDIVPERCPLRTGSLVVALERDVAGPE